jgi:HEAT repeat protein
MQKKPSSLLVTVAALVVSVAGTAGMYFYLKWLAWYIGEVSTSVERNAVYFLGWIGLLFVTMCAEALIIRDAHRLFTAREEGHASGRDEIALEIKRQVKETKTLWTVYLGAPALVNLLLMNYLSGGFVFSGITGYGQYATVATMMRSSDTAQRRRAIEDAVASSSPALGRNLAAVIAEKGELSALAAWAAGMRKDQQARPALRALYIEGNKDQRGNAVIALSEMKDFKIMDRVLADLEAGSEPRMPIIIAAGNVPYMAAEEALVRMAGDAAQPVPVRATAFWAISRIEQERFRLAWQQDSMTYGYNPKTWKSPPRQGWQPLVAALKDPSPVLRCGAVQALRYVGPIETSKDLIEAFEASGRLDKCERLSLQPYKFKAYDIVKPGLFRSDVIRALAGIGDRSVVGFLETVGNDRKNADEVILLAKDLARQIKNL